MNKRTKTISILILIGLIIISMVGCSNSNNASGNSSNPADFGISLETYINNVEGMGITNLQYNSETSTDEGMAYIYTHGDRMIFIYTRANGNIYKIIYNDTGFEYGVNQVSTLILSLASEFLSATNVSESQSSLYTAIYECLLSGGSGATYEFEDCIVGYSRTLVEHYESTWIEAK